NLVLDHVELTRRGLDDAEPAGVRHRRRQPAARDPSHRRLHDRVADAEELADARANRIGAELSVVVHRWSQPCARPYRGGALPARGACAPLSPRAARPPSITLDTVPAGGPSAVPGGASTRSDRLCLRPLDLEH